ncbi:MAG: ribonuclease III [Myxococcaceae bacterium]|nr:MAG: ribonuclease III [Myxococcaceae bacterium]
MPAPGRPPDTVLVEGLCHRLGLEALDPVHGLAALTHKSYVNEHRDEGADNERLEFLGDAVVDLAVSHRLMERFPDADEGELSKLRALLVNEETLARVARHLGLGGLLRMGRGEEMTGGRDKSSVLADALEAVIGAVYLSTGLPGALSVVDRLFGDLLEGVAEGKSGEDWKTRLQELVQTRLRQSPRYRVVSEEGPDHSKTFEVEVTVGTELFARARGRSKKEAEQAAARETLTMLDSEAKKDPGAG